MSKSIWAATLISLAGAASAQEAVSAKAVFLDIDGELISVQTKNGAAADTGRSGEGARMTREAAKPKAKPSPADRSIGASYFIRLKNADGSTSNVLATRRFVSGERFQLGLRVKHPAYVYIFNEDAHGDITLLYPQRDQTPRIDAMGIVFLPSDGAFEFDVEPGVEQLTVVMAQSPWMPDLRKVRGLPVDVTSDPTRVIACSGPAAGDSTPSIKGIATRSDAPACGGESATYVMKGIKFTEDPAPPPGEQQAAYVIKPVATRDDTLTLRIRLLHQ